jgi:hypothetical protein
VESRGPNALLKPIGGPALAAALLAWLLAGAAAAEPLRVRHSPAARTTAWQPLGIEAVIAGDFSPERVATLDVIVLRADGEPRVFPLTLSRNAAFGEIPGALVAPPELSYYVRLVETDGTIAVAPPGAPEGGLFRVAVEGRGSRAEGASPAWTWRPVEILSPEPGEVVVHGTPEVAGLIDPPLEEPWEALVLLDGRDVTASADVAPGFFVLSVPDSLATGAHRVTFSAVGRAGAVEASWVFFVRERVAASEGRPDAWAPNVPGAPPEAGWNVAGRLEVGWAAVVAETTAVESLDVFLPYEEVSRPTLDLYLSGAEGARSFHVTAQYNPVYDSELEWSAGTRTGALDVEGGRVYPSFSTMTLDWASGIGAELAVRLGRSRTRLAAIRMSEADTLAGFGLYSRFAVGAMETFDLSDELEASIVYLSVFDREGSVPEAQRLTDPLRNQVAAGLVRARRGRLDGELELARSSAEGDVEGSGTAARARLGFGTSLDNRVSLEYVTSEPEYYSAGSFEYDPGESVLGIEFAYRPGDLFRTSGWARVGTTSGPESTFAEDELGLKAYARADLSWTLAGADARFYAVGRYDRTPYETYDYEYAYGALGGTWRRGPTRALVNASWSNSRSTDSSDTWSLAIDLRHELIARRWTARAAGRWTEGSGDTTDYTRSHYTFESRWDFGAVDLSAEYWLIDRDDRADPGQTYTERVVAVGLGHAF